MVGCPKLQRGSFYLLKSSARKQTFNTALISGFRELRTNSVLCMYPCRRCDIYKVEIPGIEPDTSTSEQQTNCYCLRGHTQYLNIEINGKVKVLGILWDNACLVSCVYTFHLTNIFRLSNSHFDEVFHAKKQSPLNMTSGRSFLRRKP